MIRYQKNPKGSSKVIEIDRQEYHAKYIGKGSYSKVYRIGDRVVYYTRGDCGKEVLAMYQYDRMVHLPELIRHENITTARGTWYVFSSPYYRDVTKKDRSAWELMRSIISGYGQYSAYMAYKGFHRQNDAHYMQKFVEYMTEGKHIKYSIVKALQEIVDVASNCEQGAGFDLHKKNFGVNEYGTLIFRDPIYVWTESGIRFA
jgi:hypothetical protein